MLILSIALILVSVAALCCAVYLVMCYNGTIEESGCKHCIDGKIIYNGSDYFFFAQNAG